MATTTKLWAKVPFKEEIGEFERTALFFGEKADLQKNLKMLEDLYAKAKPEILKPDDWGKAQNTDSWRIKTLEQMERVFRRNRAFRDVSVILKEIYGPKIRCPIFIRLANKKLYLVGGNTRLMVARVIKLQPVKCIILKTDW